MIRICLVIVFVGLLIVGGCSRYIDSEDTVRSFPDEGPVPFNLSAVIGDGEITLSWDTPTEGTITRFRIYVSDSTGTNYHLRDSSDAESVRLSNLSANRLYFFKIAAVWNGGAETDLSEALSVRVAILSLGIAGGAEYTNRRDVQVQITAPGNTTHIQLSENPGFEDAVWVAFSSQKSFELSSDDGIKTVYGRLQFSDGSQSDGALSDDIMLDTEATIESVEHFPAGTDFGLGDTIRFELLSSEIGGAAGVSFGSSTAVVLYDDGTHLDLTADDGLHTGFFVVPVAFNLSNGQVSGAFKDEAGNPALAVTDQAPLTIFTPPLPVTLSALAISTFEIDLTWPASSSNNFATYRIYRDASSAVDNSSELIESISNRNSSSFRDTDLLADTEYFYRIYVFENSGLSTGSDVESATTFDNSVPEAVQFWNPGQTDSTATFVWTESPEPDFDSYRIFRRADADVDTTDQVVAVINTISTTTFTYDPPTLGTYFFRIFVFDRHGEATGSVNSVPVQFTK